MEQELHPSSFTGLIIPEVPIKPTDFIHGVPNRLGALGYRVENPTGKWADYRPPLQLQKSGKTGFESNDCTGYGYCRDVATYLNYKLRNNQLPAAFVTWATQKGYIQNGSFLFDPQVLGIVAGTTSNGNWLEVVCYWGKKFGLVPAGTLPGPDGYAAGDYAGFYNKALITPEITALGQEFLKWVDLPYQWFQQTDVQSALKAAPLYVALCTCGGWNNPPVQWCNAGDATNHAVAEMDLDPETILDSYAPDLKQLSGGYNIPYRMMVLTTVKGQPNMGTTGFKKAGDATVYVAVGSTLVPVADWNAFLAIGGSSNTVVELPATEFAKFTIATGALFKSA